MKRTKKTPLWYNPAERSRRSPAREDGLIDMAATQEGRALLESYCRLYRAKL